MNKICVSKTNIIIHLPPQSFISSFYRANNNNLSFFRNQNPPKIQTLCRTDPPTYGGWEDFQLASESTHFPRFLDSLGINDSKFIFVYVFGFLCALAVTRIRVSSVIAISASVLLFTSGFVFGNLNVTEKRAVDEILKGSVEKCNCLLDILNDVAARIDGLRDGVRRNVENDEATLADLEGVISVGDSVYSLTLNARDIVDGLLESLLIQNQLGEKYVNKKLNRRTKDGGENGFGISRFMARLFGDKLFGLNPARKKDSGKSVLKDDAANISSPAAEEQLRSTASNRETASIAQENHNNVNRDGRRSAAAKIGNMGMFETYGVSERTSTRKEYPYKNKSYRFIDNQQDPLETKHPNRFSYETWDSFDNDVSSIDFKVVDAKNTRTDVHFKQEISHNYIGRDNFNLNSIEEGETEIEKSSSQKEGSRQGDEGPQVDAQSAHDNGYGSFPSIVTDDKEFSDCLEEANLLLREAKKVLVQHIHDGNAEQVLYKSAELLSKAIELRPMSLLAIGQLGNTYLFHGELKLRISRKLRAILAGKDSLSMDIWGIGDLSDKADRNDKLMSALVNTCEECEDLLIKAGRNYRMALSIDGNDMRAMYNWGLALSFRGQLIADIGPGAARDADRVFLAAIDKFDAMLSKSNVHAPEALFRWGTALQQRSRLRPRNSKEKLKFLQQARRLYEDALDMDSSNFQVQEALSTCISELNFWYKEFSHPNKPNRVLNEMRHCSPSYVSSLYLRLTSSFVVA